MEKVYFAKNDMILLRDSAIALENIDINLSFKLMNLALKMNPNGQVINQKIEEYKNKLDNNLSPISLSLEGDIKTLKAQIKLLRNKFNQIQEALVYSDVLKFNEIDDPSAKLLPLEMINKNSTNTLVVFGGMATIPSMPPKEFFKSFINRDINLIFIKDFYQCWYHKGLIGKSNDIETTYTYIKNLIPEKTDNLICLGTSAGGYAAIRFGVDLKANRILAFAPQTNIDQEIFNKFKSLDTLQEDLSFEDSDLNKFLSKKKNNNLNIELYYGKNNKFDSEAATHIQDYIKEFKYDTANHNIASFLKNNGLLDEILDSILK